MITSQRQASEWRLARVAIALLPWCWLLVAGCAVDHQESSSSGPSVAVERALAFQQQADTTSARDDAWRPWFEHIAQTDGKARCYPQRCFQSNTQRMLWDEALSQRQLDRTNLETKEPAKRVGPLAMIVDFERQLASLGIDLLVVVVPPSAAVYPEMAGAPTPLAEGATPPLLDFRLRRFYAALENEGVEVVDLLPAFLEHRYRGDVVVGPEDNQHRELLFQRQDPHWTSLGSGLAAEVIAERLRRYPWFEAVAAQMGQARLVEKVENHDRYGAAMMRLFNDGTRDATAVPRERLLQRTVKIDGERWSFDDRSSPIVLLGDSFSAPAYNLADQMLRQLGFRVDRITVTGGAPAATLKALQLRENGLTGKRLVVWEMTSYALARLDVWRPVDVLAEPADP